MYLDPTNLTRVTTLALGGQWVVGTAYGTAKTTGYIDMRLRIGPPPSSYGTSSATVVYGTNATISANYTEVYGGSGALTLTAVMVPGRAYIVKDGQGAADTNAITVVPSGSQKIDGQTSFVLSQKYQEAAFTMNATGTRIGVK